MQLGPGHLRIRSDPVGGETSKKKFRVNFPNYIPIPTRARFKD